MGKKIFIYGSSGHFRDQLEWLKDSVKAKKHIEIAGIIDDLRKDEEYDNYSKLKIYESKSISFSENILIFIAVGDIEIRKKCINEFKKFNFYNLIHPSSIISENSILGKGISVAPFTLINGNSKIGDFNNFNSHSVVSHDCVIGNNNFFSCYSKLMGNCNVGNNNFISTNVTLIPSIEIKDNNFIGANSLLTKNFVSNLKIYGSPAIIKLK